MARRNQDDIDLGWEGDDELERLARDPNRPLDSPSKILQRQKEAHARSLGIDPDAVSDAILELAKNFKQGPLQILWTVATTDTNSASARNAAAMAILPYLQGKPGTVKKAPGALASGVMEVPVAQSMEQWMGIAAPSQAALKATVRE